jgi:hypothetical protein
LCIPLECQFLPPYPQSAKPAGPTNPPNRKGLLPKGRVALEEEQRLAPPAYTIGM